MAADRARRTRGRRGETLLESLVALLILTVVALAAYAGFRTAIKSSSQHKESAVAETLLRTAAERLQDPSSGYVDRAGCGGGATYTGLPTRTGWGPVQVGVRFWIPPQPGDPAPWDTRFAGAGTPQDCPPQDPGLQQLQLTVTTPSGSTEQLDVLKRRN